MLGKDMAHTSAYGLESHLASTFAGKEAGNEGLAGGERSEG